MTTTRRIFLGSLAAGVATSLTRPSMAGLSSNEEVGVAILGCGGRGGLIAKAINRASHAKVVVACDPDESRAGRLADTYQARTETDLRRAIEQTDVDAVVVTTCNHWHCLAAYWAIEAGKDVYVEKPLSHSQWEGRRIADFAEASHRIVQLGTQQRSDPMQAEARAFLHDENALGPIRYVQANRLGVRGSIGKRSSPLPIPSEVNYDLWLGPAADQPLFRDSFHYDWHWDWNTGSGEMGNWGVHVLDDVRNVAYQDSVTTPRRIMATGGRVLWNDAGQTPNIHLAWFDTGSFPTIIALSNLPKEAGKKGGFSAMADRAMTGPGSGYVVACENGYYLGQRGHGKAIDLSGKTIRTFGGNGDMSPRHVQNFIDAVRNRDADSLAAPVRNGHHSTGWCNLANVGFRVAEVSSHKSAADVSELPAWSSLVDEFTEQLATHGIEANQLRSSSLLTHDPNSEQFVGEQSNQANQFLKREYRSEYQIPA